MPLSDKFRELRALDKSQAPADQTRHKQLRDDLIVSVPCTQLVRVVALAIIKKVPSLSEANDLDDLVSEGTIGLISAIDKYDPEEGAQFATFAVHHVKGAMLKYLRVQSGSTATNLDNDGGLDPLDVADPDSGSERRADLREALQGAFAAVEETLTTNRQRIAWGRARRALEMRFVEGKTAREIGVIFECSEQSACNLVARAQKLLKPHLKAALFA